MEHRVKVTQWHIMQSLQMMLWLHWVSPSHPLDSCYQKKEKKRSRSIREIGTFMYCWCECKMVQLLWKRVWQFLKKKKKKRIVLWSSDSTFGYMPKRIKSRVLKRYLYSHIYSRIIWNNQKLEATQVSINKWMDKQNIVYTYIYHIQS